MLRQPEPHHGARESDGHDGERQDSYPGTTPRWPPRGRRPLRRAVGRSRTRLSRVITPGGKLLLIVLSGVTVLSGLSGVPW